MRDVAFELADDAGGGVTADFLAVDAKVGLTGILGGGSRYLTDLEGEGFFSMDLGAPDEEGCEVLGRAPPSLVTGNGFLGKGTLGAPAA